MQQASTTTTIHEEGPNVANNIGLLIAGGPATVAGVSGTRAGGGAIYGSDGNEQGDQGSVRTYDDLFPTLPQPTQWQNMEPQAPQQMRVGSSTITQVFRVPFEERKIDSEKFGEGESFHTCTRIMNETGARIEISSSKDQSLTFLVSGKSNEVVEARRKILTYFQTQASRQISIPKDHHRWILGKKGERLKELERVTATKISMPSVSDQSDVITITGPKDGIEKAEHQIRVTSDEQSKKALERVSVPKMYHPFIVGPSNKNLQAMIEETGAKITVPPPSVQQDEIVISGEKEGVLAAKAKIELIYKEMERKCQTVCVEVPKPQHKYVIGPRGSTIAEILEMTGVSVEVPSNDSNSGTITLRGPQQKLGDALSMVYNKSNSVKTSIIAAPVWTHRYIIGKKGASIKEITANLPKVHVEFEDTQIKIEGPPEEVEIAYEKIDAIAKDLVAKFIFVELTVDPKYYKHIIGKSGANVNRLKDDLNVIINVEDSGQIRIEGERKGVEQAKSELETMVKKLENEKEKDVMIEQRHYKSIIGSKGENIREIREKFNQVQISIPQHGDKRDIVKIRGPKDDVERCHKHLMKLVRDLSETSFQAEVPIYKQFHKFVIGKGGANIRKIREETQTRIDLPAEGDKNEVIIITGKKENVEEAKEKIRKIQDELETIVTDEVTIDPKFYNSLIGARGKLIHSIMDECGGVTIKFPSTESRSDKVVIRGPKEDVERAKQQLVEMANEKQLSSYTAEVRAKSQHHKFLIGKNGGNIRKIRDATGVRIVFPVDGDEDKELITIIGKKESVEEAKAKLEAIVKDIDNITESDITVDPRHHKHFVARRGEVLHRITDECGGVMISFPRPNVQSDRVVLKGSKECIEAAKQRIREIIVDLESMVTIECVIPQMMHRTVMGSKGHKVQGITADFDVQVKFPDKSHMDDYHQDGGGQMNGDIDGDSSIVAPAVRQCDIIRITGKAENCERAKQALIDLMPVTIDVEVPFDMHRSIIGAKGRDIKEIMNTHDVHIVLSSTEDREDNIKITGVLANVEQAKVAVLERVKEIEAERLDRERKSFQLTMEVNPELHPKIIGKKGAVITKIRMDHGVQITFPKKDDPESDKITIVGYEESTQRARDDIMQIVNAFNEMDHLEVEIDSRVHSRIIGARGRNIRKIMDDFKVQIKFPRSGDEDMNLVVISGGEDNVMEAKDFLMNLEEEFLQDVNEREFMDTYRRVPTNTFGNIAPQSPNQPPTANHTTSGGMGSGDNINTGFIVAGGPWEQQNSNNGNPPHQQQHQHQQQQQQQQHQQQRAAPNTASVTEFPSVGGGGYHHHRNRRSDDQQQHDQHQQQEQVNAAAVEPPRAPVTSVVWGPPRR